MAKDPSLRIVFKISRYTVKHREGAKPVVERLAKLVKQEGDRAITIAVLASQEQVIQDVKDDITAFAERVANIFTQVKSPKLPWPGTKRKRGRPVSEKVFISLENIHRKVPLSRRRIDDSAASGKQKLFGAREKVEWFALSPHTIRNKRKRGRASPETFFVDSGALKKLLTENLGPAFADILKPSITYKEDKNGRITLRIQVLPDSFRTSAARLKSYHTGDPTKSGRDELLFATYLKSANLDATLRKLGNLGRNADEDELRHHRPFLQPSFGFWLMRRFPNVFETAVRRALANPKIKRQLSELRPSGASVRELLD